MRTRAKFCCSGVEHRSDGSGPRTYRFFAITDAATPEDERFVRATPTGELRIEVDNPVVTFEPGKSYYLDFTPAD